jgi:APA family basic amino acid/polyamine antiporter
MLASLLICTVIYVAVAIVLLGIVPYPELNVADPLAVGIDRTGLKWLSPLGQGQRLVRPVQARCWCSCWGRPGFSIRMSRDGLLPRVFSSVHPRFKTPHLSTAVTGIVVSIAAGLVPIAVLGQLVSMGTLLAFVLVCIGILILRRTSPEIPRPFRTPGLPWVPIAGALICLVQMFSLPVTTWERLVVWLAIGLVIYFSYSRRGAAVTRAARRAVAA